MVMITRSAYKKACESSNNSDVSRNNIIPPWCSSGKVCHRKQGKVPSSTWEIRSSYPLRENIWEYLRDEKVEQSVISGKRRRRCNCKQKAKRESRGKNVAILFAFVIIAAGLMASIWSNNIPKINLLTKVIQSDKLISLMSAGTEIEDSKECCLKMKYLALELTKVHKTLRHAQRVRRTMMISAQISRTGNVELDKRYIEGATVTKGRQTTEYGGQIALWGVVPLWRAAPPPEIVMARRSPTPSDCWPFSGPVGDVIIELPDYQLVRHMSLEHIRPDIASSAPKHFILQGNLRNATWVVAVEGEYRSRGPAKQYYHINWNEPMKKFVFKVLSNQGNEKYTCIYRVHLYGE